jgi:hypothetical protein
MWYTCDPHGEFVCHGMGWPTGVSSLKTKCEPLVLHISSSTTECEAPMVHTMSSNLTHQFCRALHSQPRQVNLVPDLSSCACPQYGRLYSAMHVLQPKGLGAHGRRPQHVHRDLIRWCRKFDMALEPYTCNVVHKNPHEHGTIHAAHACLLPHEVFAAVYSTSQSAFDYMFVGEGGQAGLVDYWKHARTKTWAREHPGFTDHNIDPKMAIPFGFHADAGQHIKRDKMLVMAWGSIMTRAPTLWSKQLFTVCPDELLEKGIQSKLQVPSPACTTSTSSIPPPCPGLTMDPSSAVSLPTAQLSSVRLRPPPSSLPWG